MKILCNCAPVQIGGGVGRYVANLFVEMARLGGDWHCAVIAKRNVAAALVPADRRFSALPLPWPAQHSAYLRVPWEQAGLARLARRTHPDVIFCPGNVDLLLAPAAIPSVVTINVSQPWVRPKEFPRAPGLYLRVFVKLSARTGTTFIAPTETTRQELIRAVGIAPDRIVAIPYGVDVSQFGPVQAGDGLGPWATANRIRQPYLLSISSLRRWKNFDTLVKGFAASAATRRGVQLVIVGKPLDARYDREVRELAASLGVADSVIISGRAPEEEVASLYRMARAYVFPSLFEGFGLTQIEAMASGIPVALSRASVMPEVGQDAAIYFDPLDISDMARAIEQVLWDKALRARLVAAGLRRSKDFSWADTAQRTMAVLRAAADSRAKF